MKARKITLGSILIITLAAISAFGQEFTLTTTAANTVSSKSSIDMPSLTGNPLAIIVATPVGNTALLNPHPIGAWYYSGKWNIFNSDHGVMPIGAKYQVQFFLQPGPNQFLHIVTQQNLGSEGSYIDNPALNGNPNVQFKILQNHSPDVRTPYKLNMFEAKAAYSTAASRWYIANVNGEPLGRNSAYNIVIASSVATVSPTPTPTPDGTVAINPTPIPIIRPTPVDRTPVTPTVTPTPIPTPTPLNGFVDMHTHPMSYLGFGKKLVHGVPDEGSIIPAGTRNCNPTDLIATNIHDALGNGSSTHGGWGLNNVCGDYTRAFIISNFLDKDFAHRVSGNIHGDHRHEGIDSNPQFLFAPHQTSKVHQQMWWEWIKRAKDEGNLRVIVALAVNNELLAEIIDGDDPKNDTASADLQIDAMIDFVGRHDFMEIAKTPADLRRIVGAGKLAVILGMEVDNIGDFNRKNATDAAVKTEIQRLYNKGIRYVFPIHLLDNKFGGTAVYSNLFNIANKFSTGQFYDVKTGPVDFRLGVSPVPGGDWGAIQGIKTTLDVMSGIPYPPAIQADPFKPGYCPVPILGCWKTFQTIRGLFTPDPSFFIYSTISGGHVNKKGLSDTGKAAVKEMMKLGMLIDIDHMSDASQADTLTIAEAASYPLNIGHNGIRGSHSSERHALRSTIERVAALGGVFGIGTSDADDHNSDAQTFIKSYNDVWNAMAAKGGTPRVALGTDVNGMERLPRASKGLNAATFYTGFSRSQTGTRIWDYTTEGVAHYGLMADFMKDVRERNLSVHGRLMDSAEYFARMWEKAEQQKTSVSLDR